MDIKSWHAGLRPEDKLQLVHKLSGQQQQSAASNGKADRAAEPGVSGVMMVGDGINDAPALAAARVGVAVAGSPSDLVATAADVILLNGQGVANLPWLLAMADKTRQVVRQVRPGWCHRRIKLGVVGRRECHIFSRG